MFLHLSCFSAPPWRDCRCVPGEGHFPRCSGMLAAKLGQSPALPSVSVRPRSYVCTRAGHSLAVAQAGLWNTAMVHWQLRVSRRWPDCGAPGRPMEAGTQRGVHLGDPAQDEIRSPDPSLQPARSSSVPQNMWKFLGAFCTSVPSEAPRACGVRQAVDCRGESGFMSSHVFPGGTGRQHTPQPLQCVWGAGVPPAGVLPRNGQGCVAPTPPAAPGRVAASRTRTGQQGNWAWDCAGVKGSPVRPD